MYVLAYSMLVIGSVFWRFANYGIIATIKYLFIDKFAFKKKFKSLKTEQTKNFFKFCNKFTNLSDKKNKTIEANIDRMIKKVVFNILTDKQIKINDELIYSTTRLKVLGYLISTMKIDCILESGSYNGTSAFFMEEVSKSVGKNSFLKIVSFDVQFNSYLNRSTEVDFIVLKKPVRISFKKLTKYYFNNYDRILFFHDSDHSYENMTFEFAWAWDHLKVDFLVSDDVSGNSAFSEFAFTRGLNPVYCKFDDGPTVGVIKRIL
jgi:cephalosporin hydroxylase